MWPFRRGRDVDPDADDMAVETLLARAHRDSPPSATRASAVSGSFRMVVEDTFVITGRGLVATGRIEAGTVSEGDEVRVMRGDQVVAATAVTAIEQFRKKSDSATVGENVGLLLGVDKGVVVRGDLLVA